MRSRAGNNDGFTLIEVLVALTILSLSLGVIFTMISRGLETGRKSQALGLASSRAQSLLAELGTTVPVKLGTTSGVTVDYSWSINAQPYRESGVPPGAALVTLTIRWDDDTKPQELTVKTLRLLPPQ